MTTDPATELFRIATASARRAKALAEAGQTEIGAEMAGLSAFLFRVGEEAEKMAQERDRCRDALQAIVDAHDRRDIEIRSGGFATRYVDYIGDARRALGRAN